MFPNILNFVPFYAVWNYTPEIPNFYYNAKSQEQIVKYLCTEYDKLVHYCDMLSDSENETRDAVNKLTELFRKFQESGFDDYYKAQIESWIYEHMPSIIGKAMQMVFFGITDDGYFCAYVPETWSQIMFDTDKVYASTTYGHLILSFNVQPLNK
jgi:hypothetical protein